MKKSTVIIAGVLAVIALAAAFFLQDSPSGKPQNDITAAGTSTETSAAAPTVSFPTISASTSASDAATSSAAASTVLTPKTTKPEAVTTRPATTTTTAWDAPASTAAPVTTASTTRTVSTVPTTTVPTTAVEPHEPSCSILIECHTILENMDRLTNGKEVLVPRSGILLDLENVPIKDGETAFSLMQRVLTERNMHIEFMNSPMYDTVYVEGICNLYEFDCGELSGWIYSVNGKIYSYGSGDFIINPGDEVIWSYTCELGADLEANR